jgi:hypothetical protein
MQVTQDKEMDKELCVDSCRATDVDMSTTGTTSGEDAMHLSDSDLTDLDIEDIYEPTAITRSNTKTKTKSSKRGRGAASPSMPVLSQEQAPKKKFAHLFEMRRKKPVPTARSASPEKRPKFESTTIGLPSGEKITLHPTRFEYPAVPQGTFTRNNNSTRGPEKIMPNWLKDRPHLRPERAEQYCIAPAPKKVHATGPVLPETFKKSSRPNQFGKVPKFNLWQVVQGKRGNAVRNKTAGLSLQRGGGMKVVKIQPKARAIPETAASQE